MCKSKKIPAKLILSDGTTFGGFSIGRRGTTFGEMIFCTSANGYLETITDPNNFGKIVVQTFPIIGTYGVNKSQAESENSWLSGYVVKEFCNNPSNPTSKENLENWLEKNDVFAVFGLNTRQIAKKIRNSGQINGALTTEEIENKAELLEKIKNFRVLKMPEKMATKEIIIEKGSNCLNKDLKICVLNFGIKNSILEGLRKYAKEIVLLPKETKAEQIKNLNPDGIFLSNGPEIFEDNEETIENLKHIQNLKIPIFAIDFGHELLAMANYAKVKRLKLNHQGFSNPVINCESKKIIMSSQNHSYFVDCESLSSNVGSISFKNINDGSCEGIDYKKIPAFSIQFCPLADYSSAFHKFFEMAANYKIKNKKEEILCH